MKESQLIKACIARLWHERKWIKTWRANSGSVMVEHKGFKYRYQGNAPGTPDIIGFKGPTGHFVGFECKVGKNTQEDTQIAFQQDCIDKGASYYLIRSPEELEDIITAIKP